MEQKRNTNTVILVLILIVLVVALVLWMTGAWNTIRGIDSGSDDTSEIQLDVNGLENLGGNDGGGNQSN